MRAAINKLRAYVITTHIESISVKERTGTETLGASLKPIVGSGTNAELIVGGGGGAAIVFPFQLLNASTSTEAKVRVRTGVVSDFFTGYYPTGMNEDDDPVFLLNVSNGYQPYIKVTGDVDTGSGTYGRILSVDVDVAATVPTSDYATGLFYLQLGTVLVTGVHVTRIIQISGGSFGWELCGGTGRFWSLGF